MLRRVFSGFMLGLLSLGMNSGTDVLLHAARVYGILGKLSREKKCKRLDLMYLINSYLRIEYTKEGYVTSETVNNVFFSFTPPTYLSAFARLAAFGWLRRADAKSKTGHTAYEITPEGIATVKRFISLFNYSIDVDKYRRRKLGTGRNQDRTPTPPMIEGFFLDDPLSKIKPTTADPGYKQPKHPDAYSIEHFGEQASTKARELQEENTPPQVKGWTYRPQ